MAHQPRAPEPPMSPIEYFYSAHSAYAYIGSVRFMAIAKAAGRRIAHRPMDLRAVVAATGPGATNSRTPQRRAYFSGREIQRWAQFRGVALAPGWPRHHDNDIALPNCVLIAAQEQDLDVDSLAHAMLQAHWRDDADLANAATLADIARGVGLAPDVLLQSARTPSVQTIYRTNTEEAIRRSVFGSPAYFVDGDMFYGQDHLEMLERALREPFATGWPAG
jgi:2-hydroxychromene-2-carboxylate isomerase